MKVPEAPTPIEEMRRERLLRRTGEGTQRNGVDPERIRVEPARPKPRQGPDQPAERSRRLAPSSDGLSNGVPRSSLMLWAEACGPAILYTTYQRTSEGSYDQRTLRPYLHRRPKSRVDPREVVG